jgi:hypothetical protein
MNINKRVILFFSHTPFILHYLWRHVQHRSQGSNCPCVVYIHLPCFSKISQNCILFLINENISYWEYKKINTHTQDKNNNKNIIQYLITFSTPGLRSKWTKFCKWNNATATTNWEKIFITFCKIYIWIYNKQK